MSRRARRYAEATAAKRVALVPQPDDCCEHCYGTGMMFFHADDCYDDLCALNGDEHSCVGQLVPCYCVEREAP